MVDKKIPKKKAVKDKVAGKKKVSSARAQRRPKGAADLTTLGALELRIEALEHHMLLPKAFSAELPLKSVTVAFTLDTAGNTAKFSRLYFSNSPEHDVVNNLDKQRAELSGQHVGSTIQLMMEVRGDPGQKGSFTVNGATPSPLTLTVGNGPKSPKLLFVSG